MVDSNYLVDFGGMLKAIKLRNPNALHVRQTLQERILQGLYPAETWLPTERAIAEEFGVDRTVVRGALIQLDQEGFIVRSPGKRPWVKASSNSEHIHVKSIPTPIDVRTIVAILPHQGHSASSMAILQGINQALRLQQNEFSLKVEDNYGEDATFSSILERRALENAMSQRAAGVILWHLGGRQSRESLNKLSDSEIPLVLIDRIPSGLVCDFVGVDDIHSAQKAVSYLLDLGHTRIGHLSHRDSASTIAQRRQGYIDALALRGIPLDESLICVINDLHGTGRSAADFYFEMQNPPTAIFTVNDDLAHGLVSDIEHSGRKVPDDMSVIGFDDIERFSRRPAMLTTMSHPFEQVGYRAARLVLQRLQEQGSGLAKHHVLLDTNVVQRKTTREYQVKH